MVICESGFHSCLDPLDCLNYYDITDSKLAEVELSGATKKHGEDSKRASAEITIKAELTLPDFIKQAVDWTLAHTKGKTQAASGDWSTQAASGDCSKQAASGYGSKVEATGDNAVIASAGRATKAKGAKGTWISLAEYKDQRECIGFATGCIGKKGLKADTWYAAKGGKLVET